MNDLAHTIKVLELAIANNAEISFIKAEGDAQSERSIDCRFTKEQSATIFLGILGMLRSK